MFEPLSLLLRREKQTLSVAESCTGGGLAHQITSVAGVSELFLGGVIAYSNDVKIRLLNISPDILTQHGAVSEPVACLMAQNSRTLFSSTYALSTTGIAGPTGATANKPVGLVWIGIAGPTGVYARSFIFAEVSRLEHRRLTIEQAFAMLKEYCTQA